MGEVYRDLLQKKIESLKGMALNVYINPDGVSPHYRRHLEDTFKAAGATFVSARKHANFVFEGSCEPQCQRMFCVTAFLKDGQLRFIDLLQGK